MAVKTLKQVAEEDWKIKGLIQDLKEADWRFTEPKRIDRMTYIGSHNWILELAKKSIPEEIWKEAIEEGFEHEIIDDYLNALAEVVAKEMDDHVYSTYEDGDVFLGQYEDGEEDELRKEFDVKD